MILLHSAFVASMVLLSAFLLGRSLLAAALGDLRPLEAVLAHLVVGLAVLAFAMTVAGMLGWYSTSLFVSALALGPMAAVVRRSAAPAAPVPWRLRDVARKLRAEPFTCGLVLVAGLVLAIPLLGACAPELFYDAVYCHLGLQAQALLAGAIELRPTVVHSAFPAHAGVLLGAALGCAGPASAKFLHFAFLPLSVLATAAFAARVARHGPGRAAAVSAVALAGLPGMATMATTASVDLVPAFAGSVAWLMLAAARAGASLVPLVVAGFAAGLAAGSKYTGLYLLVAVAISWALVGAGPFRRRMRDAALLVLIGLAVASPWYVRNALELGNPFYPAFDPLFGPTDAGAWALERLGRDIPSPPTLADRLELVRDWLLHRPTLGAGAQLGWLIPLGVLLVPWAAWRSPGLRPAAVGGTLFLAMWLANAPAARYAYPVMAIAAVALGVGCAELAARGAAARVVVAAGAVAATWRHGLLVLALMRILHGEPSELWALATGRLDRTQWLDDRSDDHRLGRWLDDALPADAVLFLAGESRLLYLPRRVEMDSPYDRSRLGDWLAAGDAGEVLVRLRATGATHLVLNVEELARLSGYDHFMLSASVTATFADVLGRCRPLVATGPLRLFELPAAP